MKKSLLIIVAIAALGAGWWLLNKPRATTPAPTLATNLPQSPSAVSPSTQQTSHTTGLLQPDGSQGAADKSTETSDHPKPAAEAFSSADDALNAVLKGAKDFDDSILEQFTEPGENCTWCGQFYTSVRELVTNPNTPQDKKSYLAEILAISGRVDNIQTLTESIKNASSSTEADIYAEALELTVGKDDVTRYLGDQLSATNDTLREAAVSAVTNQGTSLAAETLMKHVKERGDPDAYYAVGIGPGEFVPDESALPIVQGYVQQRDEYSAVWAKSLVNAGLPGLQMLFNELESSDKGKASDDALVKDILDHVNYDDGIKELTDTIIANNKNPTGVDLARKIQDEFNAQAEEDAGAPTEQ